jgi:hypothetical protein
MMNWAEEYSDRLADRRSNEFARLIGGGSIVSATHELLYRTVRETSCSVRFDLCNKALPAEEGERVHYEVVREGRGSG